MQKLPGGLAALPEQPPVPTDNPQTPAKIELGKMLFFDTRLSRDYSLSCATCHDPDKAYSDGRSKAVGIGNNELPRHSPSILNAAYNSAQFWDGRASSLEEQARGPIMNDAEMGMPDERTLVSRLQAETEYRERFREVFGGEINLANIAKSLAAFERTLVTPDSSFDRYAGGDKNALSDQQKRGLVVFFGKGSCTQCHNGVNLTDNQYYSLGARSDNNSGDMGRFAVTKNAADQGAFKTPGLRNIGLRAPYMHDGAMPTLEEVLDWYDRGGGTGPKSSLLHQLDLTHDEKLDLLAFLESLNGKLPVVHKPALPPRN
jgi:cytochrome c peroxidase